MKNICLVGIGPHAKRIYLNYFKKHKINLSLVVELESNCKKTEQYLKELDFKNFHLFSIDDKYKDNEHLPSVVSNNLLAVCQTLNITHIIISTEPKAHFAYLEFALKNNFNVLSDKPITVVKDMTSLKSIEKIRKQYYELLKLAEQSTGSCKIMCQRQYHRGYEKVKEILTETVDKFKVPITNIEIFHSDGAWEFPHDLNKENHPYKYGYGKLFHSGYHFIDLLSDFIKINDCLPSNKCIDHAEVYSKVFTPNDEMNILTLDDYKELFKNQNLSDYYNQETEPDFNKYGEKDYHGLLTFYNKNGFTITTANLNLIHDGVSRRSWAETRDFYKSNGRIRHERINIEIAHLMNIQVHSYQSKEICDRTSSEESVGGLEHFDIYIFSNPLVNKETFKVIHLGDMYSEKEKKEFMGYNELSRDIFLTNFLNNKDCKGDLKDQALAIEILYSCAKGIHNHYAKINKTEKIKVRNNYTYRYFAKKLKQHSNVENRDYEKVDLHNTIHSNDNYTLYSFLNYIPEKKIYESFISIDDSKDTAGSLLYKTFKNRLLANLYYKVLTYLIINKKPIKLEKIIEDR